jgi:hypothetical protein
MKPPIAPNAAGEQPHAFSEELRAALLRSAAAVVLGRLLGELADR